MWSLSGGCMYVYWLPLCNCVHGKGQHQLGLGESSIVPTARVNLARNTLLADMQQLCSRALKLGWETMEKYPRTIPGPIPIGPKENRISNPHFTSWQNYQILSQKDPSWAVGLLLWLDGRRYWCLYRKYFLFPAYTSHLGCLTLSLHSMLGPHLLASAVFEERKVFSHVNLGSLLHGKMDVISVRIPTYFPTNQKEPRISKMSLQWNLREAKFNVFGHLKNVFFPCTRYSPPKGGIQINSIPLTRICLHFLHQSDTRVLSTTLFLILA